MTPSSLESFAGPSAPTLAVLGPDAVLAAAPATQAQLVAACTQLGFDAVVPASWGDELLAEATLRHLGARREPVVLCACPSVHAIAGRTPRIARHVLALVSPAVATARYLRMLYAPARVRIVYLGDCAGISSGDIDAHRSVQWVLDALHTAGIDAGSMPDEPAPGHRRHLSLAGGAPHPDVMRSSVRHQLVSLSGEDAVEMAAARVARGESVLIDLAPATGCGCAGGSGRANPDARAALTALEPPRAAGEVLSPTIRPDLTLGASRVGPRPADTSPPSIRDMGEREVRLPTVPLDAAPAGAARRRFRSSGMLRAIGALAPATRTGEGRIVPRAYLGHRGKRTDDAARLTPADGMSREIVMALGNAPLADAPGPRRSSGAGLVVRLPHAEPYRVPPPPSRGTSLGRLALLLLAIVALILLLVAFG